MKHVSMHVVSQSSIRFEVVAAVGNLMSSKVMAQSINASRTVHTTNKENMCKQTAGLIQLSSPGKVKLLQCQNVFKHYRGK